MFPEAVVNMEDFELSSDSDVVLNLTYSEESHDINGYIYSDAFLGKFAYPGPFRRGPIYPNLLVHGTPKLLFPNRLKVKVYDVVLGETLDIDKVQLIRDGQDGIITVSSNVSLLHKSLRFSPDEYLKEDDLDFRSLLERASDYNRD